MKGFTLNFFLLVWDIWFNVWNFNSWKYMNVYFRFQNHCFGMVGKQWFTNVRMTVIFLIYHFWFQLRTYATKYFPCWNIFNTLHTVCFIHGLSIYVIKRTCHCAHFFKISYWSFQHLTNFIKIYNNNTSPKYRAKTVVIFSPLISFNLNYCLWPQTF